MTTTTYPETIFESADSWGEPTFVAESECERIEGELRNAFGVDDLDGEWTEWDLKTQLPDGTAVYSNRRAMQGDGKTHIREWFHLMRACAADVGYFEKLDGGANDDWSPERDE